MTRTAPSRTSRHPETRPRDAGSVRRVTACLAAFVLARATGLPRGSADKFMPDAGESDTPYFGI